MASAIERTQCESNKDDLKPCASCKQRIHITNFSKRQLRRIKKRGGGRCNPCIEDNNNTASISSRKRSQITNETGKDRPKNSNAMSSRKRRKSSSQGTGCASCKERQPSAFPLDTPIIGKSKRCSSCIFKEALDFPRPCQKCGVAKPQNQYGQVRDLSWGNTNTGTTEQIQAAARQTIEGRKLECLACVTARVEAREEKAAEEKRVAMEEHRIAMKEHGVCFYDFFNPVPPLRYTVPRPTQLAGTYDIVFHSGSVAGEEIENRTTKGKVTIVEDPPNTTSDDDEEAVGGIGISATVEFNPALRSQEAMSFQYDFNIARGSHSCNSDLGRASFHDVDDHWVCKLRAQLIDPKARDVVHISEEEDAGAYLRCVTQRAALAWIKHEHPYYSNGDGERVTFETLEEAEAIAREHEQGPDTSHSWLIRHKNLNKDLTKRIQGYCRHNHKPVFFVEPGDLILYVMWGEDHRQAAFTNCILRRQSD